MNSAAFELISYSVSQSSKFSMAVQEPIVFPGFLAFPNTLLTVRMEGVIMVLVHCAHHGGHVHDRDTSMHGKPTGKHLIVIRYGEDHNLHDDWDDNGAEIDTAKVLWAREAAAAQTAKLFAYLRNGKSGWSHPTTSFS